MVEIEPPVSAGVLVVEGGETRKQQGDEGGGEGERRESRRGM